MTCCQPDTKIPDQRPWEMKSLVAMQKLVEGKRPINLPARKQTQFPE